MSISNTVSKVEEFEYDNASEMTKNHHLLPKAKQLSVKSLTRAVKA